MLIFTQIFIYFLKIKNNTDPLGITNVIGEDFPYLGASVALTPAEEAVANRAMLRSAAMGAAASF